MERHTLALMLRSHAPGIDAYAKGAQPLLRCFGNGYNGPELLKDLEVRADYGFARRQIFMELEWINGGPPASRDIPVAHGVHIHVGRVGRKEVVGFGPEEVDVIKLITSG